jgi:hypothetical protein
MGAEEEEVHCDVGEEKETEEKQEESTAAPSMQAYKR